LNNIVARAALGCAITPLSRTGRYRAQMVNDLLYARNFLCRQQHRFTLRRCLDPAPQLYHAIRDNDIRGTMAGPALALQSVMDTLTDVRSSALGVAAEPLS